MNAKRLSPIALSLGVLLAVAGACARPSEYERERAAFEYVHPPLGARERTGIHAVLDSLARAVRERDRERVDSLVTTAQGRAWAVDHHGMFSAFQSATLSRGYWLRRRADTAWVHYTVPHNSCTNRWSPASSYDRAVFVMVRDFRGWRVADGWLEKC